MMTITSSGARGSVRASLCAGCDESEERSNCQHGLNIYIINFYTRFLNHTSMRKRQFLLSYSGGKYKDKDKEKSKTRASIDKDIKKDCHSEHPSTRTLMYENAKAASLLEAAASNRPLFHSPASDGSARSTCDKQTKQKH